MTIRRSHPAAVLGPLLLVLALAVTGCGSGASDSKSADASSSGEGAPNARSALTTRNADGIAKDASNEPVQRRAVISTGSVDLESKDVGGVRDDVDDLLAEHDGFLADERNTTDDDGAASHAQLVLRVPSAKFATVMDALAKLGRLQDSSRKAKDVTTEVIDVEQRVRAQQIGLHRLEKLLGRAESLPDLLRIERDLTQRRADLDSLKSQRGYLTNQTSLATISVRIDRSARAVRHEDHAGFVAGLGGGWHGLTVFLNWALTATGATLPFAGAALVLLLPARALVRLVRRHRVPVTATAE